jgi:hypothetical protein
MSQEVFISGGFLLMRPDRTQRHSALSDLVVSICSCWSEFLPDTWCLAWAEDGRRAQDEHCRRFGLNFGEYHELSALATAGFDSRFGWSNVIFDLDVALDLQRRYGRSRQFRLFEIGLHESDVSRFVEVATPPPQQPGYAPNGEAGALTQLKRSRRMSSEGRVLGFEPLSFFLAMGHSWYCAGLQDDLAKEGILPNASGLIEDHATAESIVLRLASGDLSGEPEPYFPWRISVFEG